MVGPSIHHTFSIASLLIRCNSIFFAVPCDTASLSVQKDFLGGGVAKNNPIFVKQILLHHIYAIIWEFIWTKCVTHLLVFLI